MINKHSIRILDTINLSSYTMCSLVDDYKGFLEDHIPAANMDPSAVASLLAEIIILHEPNS